MTRLFPRLLSAILIICIAKPLNAETQESTTGSYRQDQVFALEKIIVTAKRAPVGLSEVAADVTVLTEDEIKALPVRNLGEALYYIPGVYIDPRKGFGRATAISIQGCSSRHVRVMIDGIPLNNHSSGQVDPSKFPIENVQRIEVIKGAASSLWGSALGGVINIITKDTGETLIPKGSITVSRARYQTQKENLDLSGKAGNLGYYLFSSLMNSDGKGERAEVDERKVFGKVSYDLKDMGLGKVISSFGYSRGDVESGELPNGTWLFRPYQCKYGKIGWIQDHDNVNLAIEFKHFWQLLTTTRYNDVAIEDFSTKYEYKDKLYQLSLNSSLYPRERDLLVIGVDFDWAILKSSTISRAKRLKSQAPYLNYTLKIGPLDSIFGLRYDNNSEYGGDFSPSVGIVYHFEKLPGTLIKLSASQAFNAPPLLWKYYEDAWFKINPNLEAEHARVYEGVFESQLFPNCWGKLTLYRANILDAIATTRVGAKYQRTNFQRFRRQGIEGQLKLELFQGLTLFGSCAYNDAEDRVTKQTVRDINSPRQSFNIGTEYKNRHGFRLYLDGWYNRWHKTWTTYRPNTRKFVFDLKTSQKIKNFTCFLNIYNLTGAKYWADYYYPIPRTYFEGGITFEW